MSKPSDPSVALDDLFFTWPDGTPVLQGITAAFGTGRTGLLGANGTGKTTLLRLIAGELQPTAGSITVSDTVGYLPQHLILDTAATVADLLGIRDRLDALRAIESGDTDPVHFEILDDAWDVEARALAALAGTGLDRLALDRSVGTLSGGETVLTALAGLRMRGDGIVLLDEPTNNLDRIARRDLHEAILAWRGALIVVSHDVALLDLMDDTAELHAESLTVFGGGYSAYHDHLRQEQEAARRALRTADQKVKLEERQRAEAQIKLARRKRYADKQFENKREPKIVMNLRKAEAQVSAGRLRGNHDDRVETALAERREQAERVREDRRIRIDLPDPDVPASRRLAEIHDRRGTDVLLQGPERMALTGRTGVGKTRLLEMLVDPDDPGDGRVRAVAHTDRIGYLPQRLDHLNDDATVLDTVWEAAPDTPNGEVRANLARFLFRADTVHRRVGDLSGGERFRVALARLLLADPPNQLLVLDEPTNNLDLDSVDELVSALEAFRGGLLVVSHDDVFLDRLGIHTWVELDETGSTTVGRRGLEAFEGGDEVPGHATDR